MLFPRVNRCPSKHYKLDTCTKTGCLIFLSCGCNQYLPTQTTGLSIILAISIKKKSMHEILHLYYAACDGLTVHVQYVCATFQSFLQKHHCTCLWVSNGTQKCSLFIVRLPCLVHVPYTALWTVNSGCIIGLSMSNLTHHFQCWSPVVHH